MKIYGIRSVSTLRYMYLTTIEKFISTSQGDTVLVCLPLYQHDFYNKNKKTKKIERLNTSKPSEHVTEQDQSRIGMTIVICISTSDIKPT